MPAMLFYVGGLVAFVGWLWLVVLGFQKSPLWGLLNLFLCPGFPICAVIFGFQHLRTARIPLILLIGGLVASFIGQSMAPPFIVITSGPR